jgi:hypothetical protein
VSGSRLQHGRESEAIFDRAHTACSEASSLNEPSHGGGNPAARLIAGPHPGPEGDLTDAGTVCSPLVPRNLCGADVAAVLGLRTPPYLPFCCFDIASLLLTLAVSFQPVQHRWATKYSVGIAIECWGDPNSSYIWIRLTGQATSTFRPHNGCDLPLTIQINQLYIASVVLYAGATRVIISNTGSSRSPVNPDYPSGVGSANPGNASITKGMALKVRRRTLAAEGARPVTMAGAGMCPAVAGVDFTAVSLC